MVDVGVRSSRLGLLLPPSLLIRYLPPRWKRRERRRIAAGVFLKKTCTCRWAKLEREGISPCFALLCFSAEFFFMTPRGDGRELSCDVHPPPLGLS